MLVSLTHTQESWKEAVVKWVRHKWNKEQPDLVLWPRSWSWSKEETGKVTKKALLPS